MGGANHPPEPGARSERFALYWILGALPLLLALAFAVHTVISTDIWWHLSGGRYIAANHALPGNDPLSFTASHREWVDIYWAFQLAAWFAYRLGGPAALVYLQAGIAAAIFLMLLCVCRNGENALITASWLVLVVFVVKERFLVRPHLVTFLMLAAYVFILWNLQKGRKTAVYFLPVLQVIWVNMHGLHAMGLGLLSAFFAGALFSRLTGRMCPAEDRLDRSRLTLLGAALAACAAVTVLNPWGFRGVLYPLLLISRFGDEAARVMGFINEAVSPFSSGIPSRVRLPYAGMVLLVVLSFLLNRKRFRLQQGLMVLPFLILALRMIRIASPFAIVASWAVVLNFTEWARATPLLASWRRARFWRRSIHAGLCAALCLFVVMTLWSIVTDKYYLEGRSRKRFGTSVSRVTFSEDSIRFIRENRLQPEFFNTYPLGGYLGFKLSPDYRVFIDGRMELYEIDLYSLYIKIMEQPGQGVWDRTSNRYRLRFAVVQVTDAYSLALLKYLYLHPDWVPVHLDETCLILVRDIEENREVVARHAIDLAGMRGFKPEDVPDDPLSVLFRGNLFTGLGLAETARSFYDAAALRHPDQVPILIAQARQVLAGREFEQAVRACDGVLKGHPREGELYYIRGVALYHLGRKQEAPTDLKKALKHGFRSADLHYYLALLHVDAGELRQALEEVNRTLWMDPGHRPATALKRRIGNAPAR